MQHNEYKVEVVLVDNFDEDEEVAYSETELKEDLRSVLEDLHLEIKGDIIINGN